MSLTSLIPRALAQAGPPAGISDAGCNFLTGDAHFSCIPAYISNLTFVVIGFTASLSLLMLIMNGFRYMIGPVTEGSSDAAKKGITYALVGLAVSLLIYIIIETIVTSITS